MAKKWEYLSDSFLGGTDVSQIDEFLNEFGNDGWELVSVAQYKPSPQRTKEMELKRMPENSIFTAFFKREKID